MSTIVCLLQNFKHPKLLNLKMLLQSRLFLKRLRQDTFSLTNWNSSYHTHTKRWPSQFKTNSVLKFLHWHSCRELPKHFGNVDPWIRWSIAHKHYQDSLNARTNLFGNRKTGITENNQNNKVRFGNHWMLERLETPCDQQPSRHKKQKWHRKTFFDPKQQEYNPKCLLIKKIFWAISELHSWCPGKCLAP